MRILDTNRDQKIDAVMLFLTRDEASQLKDFVVALLKDPHGHFHVSSYDYKKEITVCMYDPNSPPDAALGDRYKKLITRDE